MTARRLPAETEPVAWTALAWPSHADWGRARKDARREVLRLAQILATGADPGAPAAPADAGLGDVAPVPAPPAGAPDIDPAVASDDGAGDPEPQPHPVRCLAATHAARGARDQLEPVDIPVVPAVMGDVWLRDTGPIFAAGASGPVAVAMAFNGWGGRYLYEGDDAVAPALARLAQTPLERLAMVGEGGALVADGEGTVISTRAVLLNANRNPALDAGDVEALLRPALGVERMLWLEAGLLNDHTDGHADTLARFVAPGLVVVQAPAGREDPNAAVLDAISLALDNARDAHGRPIEIARIPGPGLVLDDDKRPASASYLNFVLRPGLVVMPDYGSETVEAARAALSTLFPDRRVIAAPASGLLSGGGAFHCASLEIPRSDLAI